MVKYVYNNKNKHIEKRGYIPYNEGRIGLSKFEIKFYHKENGTCPFVDFLSSLDLKMRARVLRMLMLLEQNGNELREPYSKMLDDGIFELRVKQGSNISRALYFFLVGHKIVVTNGFIKKTEKTPVREINLAKKYRADYVLRKEFQHE